MRTRSGWLVPVLADCPVVEQPAGGEPARVQPVHVETDPSRT
jgi:hypothetical protein